MDVLCGLLWWVSVIQCLLLLLLWLQVSAHVNCTLQVTITGNDWLQVQGVAVEPYDSAAPMSAYDVATIRRGR
jgi:hypothetical protein